METLAAFDIGSGKIKATCADVVVKDGERSIENVRFEEYEKIGFAKALESSPDGEIHESIIEYAGKQLAGFKKKAENAGATQIVAVATAALRRAKNGDHVKERLEALSGLKIEIISQEEEAQLGFTTAQRVSKIAADKLVCWDSGSASFQISWMNEGKLHRHCGPLGKIPAMHILIETLKKKTFKETSSSNPVNFAKARDLVTALENAVSPACDELKQKLAECTLVGIGTKTSTFGLCQTAVGARSFSLEKLWLKTLPLLNKTDADLKERFPGTSGKRIVPPILLVYSVMRKLGIRDVSCCRTMGSAVGILCTPKYWKTEV